MKHTIRCRSFRAVAKGTLRGFATIHVVELRLAIHDVALHTKGEARWAQLPSKPVVRDGRHIVDVTNGKPQYVPIFEFDDRETRDAFSARVWRAVVDQYPEVVPMAEAAT
jgi:hypothetical protein